MASVEHSFNSRTPANLIPGATWDEVHHLANITGISGILRMMGKLKEEITGEEYEPFRPGEAAGNTTNEAPTGRGGFQKTVWPLLQTSRGF